MKLNPLSASSQQAQLAKQIEEEERIVKQQALERKETLRKDAERMIDDIEIESAKKMTAAQLQSQKTAQEAQQQIDHMRHIYGKEMQYVQAKNEESLLNTRAKGEAVLQQQIRENNKNINQSRRQYEQYQLEQDTRYKSDLGRIEAQGKRQIQEATLQTAREKEFVVDKGNKDIQFLRENYHTETQRLSSDLNDKQKQFAELNRVNQEKMESDHLSQSQTLREHFETRYKGFQDRHQSEIARLDKDAELQKKTLLAQNTQSLSSYQNQLKDPFYQLQTVQNQLSDKGDFYEFSAIIPPHEQSGVSVNIKGNELVLNGSRSMEAKDASTPGVRRESHGYQSYRYAVQLAEPVDPKRLQRYFEGDKLVVRVPKLRVIPS